LIPYQQGGLHGLFFIIEYSLTEQDERIIIKMIILIIENNIFFMVFSPIH
jgi:hypothetical protein